MENKKENKKVVESVIFFNSDLVDFVGMLKSRKIEVGKGNKEEIKKMYEESFGFKFNNVERRIKRNEREDLKKVKNEYLGLNKISLEEYENVCENLIDMNKRGKGKKISVRV